jgi:uncharacterized protein YndB with AHSA1/START domain
MSDKIEKSIEINAPVERVWRALTDHQAFGEWFRVKIDQPFVPGQPQTGHMTYPGYEHFPWNAETVALEEPTRFAFTWHPYAVEEGVDYSGETPTLVEFRLEPTASGTRVTVTESGFDKIPEHRREEALRSNTGGWEEQMRNIKAYVER